MSHSFRPCPSCARHIKVSERLCPHCQSDCGSIQRSESPSFSSYARLLGLCVATGVSSMACFGCAYGSPALPDTENETGTTSMTGSGSTPTQSSASSEQGSSQDQSESAETTSGASATSGTSSPTSSTPKSSADSSSS